MAKPVFSAAKPADGVQYIRRAEVVGTETYTTRETPDGPDVIKTRDIINTSVIGIPVKDPDVAKAAAAVFPSSTDADRVAIAAAVQAASKGG
jgi:hypothetical protein